MGKASQTNYLLFFLLAKVIFGAQHVMIATRLLRGLLLYKDMVAVRNVSHAAYSQ